MKSRLITTVVVLATLILGFWLVPYFMDFMLPVVLGVCAYETSQILWLGCLSTEKKSLCVFARVFMAIGLVTSFLAWVWLQSTVASLGAVSIFFWLVLFARKKTPESFSRTFTLFGALSMYVLIPFILLWEIYNTFGLEVVFFMLVPVWFSDTGAYVVGKSIGKRLLAPTVSPGKTWEGFFGGVLIGSLSALVFYSQMKGELAAALGEMTVVSVLFWGFAISVLGQFGDLVQSNLKRASGLKDSGVILPGHGGMLDRIDSLLFVVPVVALSLSFFG